MSEALARRLIDNVLSGRGAFDWEVVEELLHVDADRFVVAVDGCPVGRLAALTGLRMPARMGARI
jgi:hypothetical protein